MEYSAWCSLILNTLNIFTGCHFPILVTPRDTVLHTVTQPKPGMLQELSSIMQHICTCYIYSSEAGCYFDQSVARPLHRISPPVLVISTAEALNTPRHRELRKAGMVSSSVWQLGFVLICQVSHIWWLILSSDGLENFHSSVCFVSVWRESLSHQNMKPVLTDTREILPLN